MKALLDTNILVDYLNGVESARGEMARHDALLISAVSWMEVMVGATEEEEPAVRGFLAGFEQVPVDEAVAETAVILRREHGMRLPDAIIWASAKSREALLVSRNTKDFPADAPDVRAPYSV